MVKQCMNLQLNLIHGSNNPRGLRADAYVLALENMVTWFLDHFMDGVQGAWAFGHEETKFRVICMLLIGGGIGGRLNLNMSVNLNRFVLG